MSLLPLFSFDHNVTADDGREDKIEATFGTWTFYSIPDELDELREYMSVLPARQWRNLVGYVRDRYGYLFNRPNDPQGRRNPLHIRNRPYPVARLPEHIGRPLFGGDWMLRYSQSNTGERRDFHTVLRLSLNPQRFLRNQPVPSPIGSLHTWEQPRITELENRPDCAGEFSLDGADNWLPNTSTFRAFATPARWRVHLRRYFQAVRDAFTAELERVMGERQMPALQEQEDCSIRTVETAFDFATNSPLELVNSLVPLLSGYRADNVEVNEYRVPQLQTERVQNSLSVRVRIRDNTWLRVYAKTNRRVRFEIIHDEINIREVLGEAPVPTSQSGPRPRRSLAQLLQCLSILRERAAAEMNAFLQYCRHRSHIEPSHISPMLFLVEVANVLRDGLLAQIVVSILTNLHGVISSRRASDEVLDAAHALADAGILKYDRSQRGYVPTVDYEMAVALLRDHETIHTVTTGRQRFRSHR